LPYIGLNFTPHKFLNFLFYNGVEAKRLPAIAILLKHFESRWKPDPNNSSLTAPSGGANGYV